MHGRPNRIGLVLIVDGGGECGEGLTEVFLCDNGDDPLGQRHRGSRDGGRAAPGQHEQQRHQGPLHGVLHDGPQYGHRRRHG